MSTLNKKLLVPEAMRSHPALEKIYTDNRGQKIKEDDYEKFFMFVIIDRYVQVNRQQLRSGLGGVDTLMYLQNSKPIDNYTRAVNTLTDRLLPIIENPTPKTQKYVETLKRFRSELRQIAGSTSELFVLGQAIRALLNDSGDEANKRPGLVDFWAMAENAQLAEDFKKLGDEVSYGDPLYVAKTFGKGRVTAFMTSAGASWNDLEGPGKYYPPLMINMQSYLASSGTDANLVLGGAYEFALDRNVYDSKVRKWRLAEDAKANKTVVKPLGDELMSTDEKADAYRLIATDGKNNPGVYLYRFLEKRRDAARPGERQEPAGLSGFAFQRRRHRREQSGSGNSDDITQIARGASLHTASDESLKDKLIAGSATCRRTPGSISSF